MKIYLSHPYGGKQENMVKAARLARVYKAQWEKEGRDNVLVNPLEIFAGLSGVVDEDAILYAAIDLMRGCDAVMFAPGWENSVGCQTERDVCREEGIEAYFVPAGMVA